MDTEGRQGSRFLGERLDLSTGETHIVMGRNRVLKGRDGITGGSLAVRGGGRVVSTEPGIEKGTAKGEAATLEAGIAATVSPVDKFNLRGCVDGVKEAIEEKSEIVEDTGEDDL